MNYFLRKQETKSILKYSAIIGIAFLSISIFSVQISHLYVSFIKFLLNTDYNGAREAISSSYVSISTYNIVVTSISFILPFTIITKLIFREKISNIVSTNKPKCSIGLLFSLIVLSIGFCFVGSVSSYVINVLINDVFGVTPYQIEYPEAVNSFEFIFSIASTAIIAPLLEEFAFRGVILGFLKRFGKSNAIIISSLLFAIMHGNFIQIPFAFIMGLALGYITIATDSIWPAIIVHVLNNFLAVISTYFQNIIYLFFICFIFGLSVLVYIIKNKPFADSFKERVFYNSNIKRFCLILFNPAVLIGIILFVYDAVMMVR